jgi:type IV pilus assembly protein PilW
MSRITSAASSQGGYTLPELLIGLTLGLLVIVAASASYTTSQHTWRAMATAEAVHANARVALRNIREHAQLAGAAYLISSSSDGQLAVDISSNEAVGQAAIAGVNSSKSVQSLTLGHWHALDAVDCQGNTSSSQSFVRNDYKLNTNKELSCKDLNLSNSTYQALAEGIEDLQLRYAEANLNTQTLQWKTADQVSDMTRVMAIEVCLRVASVSANHQIKASATGCQDEALPLDGRLRRTFKQVIALRNRSGVMP